MKNTVIAILVAVSVLSMGHSLGQSKRINSLARQNTLMHERALVQDELIESQETLIDNNRVLISKQRELIELLKEHNSRFKEE